MNQRNLVLWLRTTTLVVAAAVLFIFCAYIPLLANGYRAGSPDLAFLFWPCLAFAWLIGLIVLAMLYCFWLIIREIARDNAFSRRSSKLMVMISRLSASMALLFLLCFLVFSFNWGGPGEMLVFLGCAFFAITLSIIAAALSHLVLKAAELKEENDMTV